jgi:single-strand DNA-binding protein
MNKSIIVGRLGRDPEVRTTQSGIAVCNLAVATDDREKKGGEWVKVTDWHQVVCFGNDAEFAGKYLVKGSSVAVEGKAKRRKYTDKTGAERESFEIVADRVEAVGSRPAEQGAAPRPAQSARASAGADFSDEVPF